MKCVYYRIENGWLGLYYPWLDLSNMQIHHIEKFVNVNIFINEYIIEMCKKYWIIKSM